MRIAIVQYAVFWLNNIPKEGQTHSPKEIIMGEQKIDVKFICKLPFGAYVQVHEDRDITNTMLPRTTGAINLGPSNLKGGHKFLSLETGDIIVRKRWTEMRVPTDVIIRLEEMSTDPSDYLNEFLDESISEVIEDECDNISEEEENEIEMQENLVDIADDSDNIYEEEGNIEGIEEDSLKVQENHDELINENHDESEISDQNEGNIERSEANTTTHRYNLRPNRSLNYSHKYSFLSVHASVKRWGDRAKEAIKDELKTLIKEKVFEEVQKPTDAQIKKALMIHCFVIEKCDGRIKARAVADGRSQQRYTEEETYSPTVKLESIFLTAFIDARAGRHIVTIDIKGAFLKAKVPDDLEMIVKMTGELA